MSQGVGLFVFLWPLDKQMWGECMKPHTHLTAPIWYEICITRLKMTYWHPLWQYLVSSSLHSSIISDKKIKEAKSSRSPWPALWETLGRTPNTIPLVHEHLEIHTWGNWLDHQILSFASMVRTVQSPSICVLVSLYLFCCHFSVYVHVHIVACILLLAILCHPCMLRLWTHTHTHTHVPSRNYCYSYTTQKTNNICSLLKVILVSVWVYGACVIIPLETQCLFTAQPIIAHAHKWKRITVVSSRRWPGQRCFRLAFIR